MNGRKSGREYRYEKARERVKNLAKDTGVNDSDLCTPTRPYRLARLGTSLRVRGKRTTKEERNYSFIKVLTAK